MIAHQTFTTNLSAHQTYCNPEPDAITFNHVAITRHGRHVPLHFNADRTLMIGRGVSFNGDCITVTMPATAKITQSFRYNPNAAHEG